MSRPTRHDAVRWFEAEMSPRSPIGPPCLPGTLGCRWSAWQEVVRPHRADDSAGGPGRKPRAERAEDRGVSLGPEQSGRQRLRARLRTVESGDEHYRRKRDHRSQPRTQLETAHLGELHVDDETANTSQRIARQQRFSRHVALRLDTAQPQDARKRPAHTLDDGWTSEPVRPAGVPTIDDGWVLATEPLASVDAGADAKLRTTMIVSTPGRVVIYPDSIVCGSVAYRAQCSWIEELGADADDTPDKSVADRETRWRLLWSWATR